MGGNVALFRIAIPPHSLYHDTTYRIWSLVSRKNCLLRNKNDRTIKCDGSVASNQGVLLDNIKVKDVSAPTHRLFRLELQVPNTPSNIYVITGIGENQDINVKKVDASSPPNTSGTKFEPEVFYAFTRFRCSGVGGKNDLYLASDENGRVTLAKGGLSRYPNPATLFVITEI
ncbi:uncharacterized protein LOC116291045 [Actinia tenebrosa]|uniref:Uncharacterized protein LOC116291045 n=1 Tax=Actinia tenebrosa TaxID=6105 RepID=A0A6P8HGD8_ACTTE|nr:uncharacterized protein LOC116291045 [Actinia tenebrosa]